MSQQSDEYDIDLEFEGVSTEKIEKALQLYDVVEQYINDNNLENSSQVYQSIAHSWEAMRALTDACDIVGYPTRNVEP